MKQSLEVLARKYRPKSFDELIGQESVSQTLSMALDANRLSHAYLFSGLRGSGKTSTARIFAKALICDTGITHKPCQTCPNCIMALENRHIDIVEMDAASNRGIDDIRLLIEQTKYKPASARFKIFIIDEVHMLTTQAFNALLKTLEEPPPFVKFILATTDPLKVPATILSRSQHFRFKPISQTKISDHLAHILNIEGIGYEPEALNILARSGAGSLRDTLTLLDQAIVYSKNFVDVQTVTEMLGLVDPKFFTTLFDDIFNKNEPRIIEHIKFLEEYEAQMVIDELILFLKERMFAQDAKYSTLMLDRFFRILNDSKLLLYINADGSFVLSLVFLKMIEAMKVKEIDMVIESLQQESGAFQQATQPSEQYAKPIMKPQEHEEQRVKQPIATAKEIQFNQLVASIKDRNAELGLCFEKSITFIDFTDNILSWESCTDDECKKTLTNGYGVIKQLVREVFGFSTQIKHSPCTKQPQQHIPENQSASMTEDIETMSASCTVQCNDEQAAKEINGADILQEEMVQKALELFEAKKVTVQSRV